MKQYTSIEFVEDLISKGYEDNEISVLLNKQEYSSSEISEALSKVETLRVKYAYKKAKHQLIQGIVLAILGVAITLGTYIYAKGGGVYMITWGAILYGLYQFHQGFEALEKLDRDSDEREQSQ